MKSSAMSGRSGHILALALKKADFSDADDSYLHGPLSSDSEYIPSTASSNNNENDSRSESLSPVIETIPRVIVSSLHLQNETPSTSRNVEGNQHNMKKQTRIRRKHNCLFCQQNVGNFFRHLERNHDDELAVQEILMHPKTSRKRKQLINKLRHEGDFCTSNIVPVKKELQRDFSNYIVCKFCRGYYSRKSLRRHAKTCFFNPDPSKRFFAQKEGHTLMAGYFGPNDILKMSGLVDMMKADDVSLTAKKDSIICEVGRRYLRKHKEKHLVLVAKRNMRRLARLLLKARTIEKQNIWFIDLLKPTKFKLLVKCTHEISGYDEKNGLFRSPSLALQMGTLLKNAIPTAHSLEIQKENCCKNRLEEFKILNDLIVTDWALEVSSEASQNLSLNKFNKPTLIPAAEDIKKFDEYLKNLLINSKIQLAEGSENAKIYKNLQEAIFCSLIIFNKRRIGELSRMTYLAYLNTTQMTSTELEKALSESEKILYKSFKRVVIRRKRGRGVPVLFEKLIVESIDFANVLREKFNLASNPYLFGIPGTEKPIAGNVVMRKHAKLAFGNSNKSSLLTSTKLRKHLATILQILKLDKSALEQLAGFMGHTERTHSEFYRLPDDIYQTAKVSKLLMIANSASIDQYKGKKLDEIEVTEDIIEDDNSETEEETDNRRNEEINITETPSTAEKDKNQEETEEEKSKIKKKQKRKLVPWTDVQKTLTLDYFKVHIKKKIAPKKHEVMKLIEMNPEVFANKSWQVVKVFVQNKYTLK